MKILRADEISIKINGKTLLNKISFTIRQGEQWAVVGPSGCGKTTLLKAIIGRQFFTGKLEIGEPGNETRIALVDQQHHFRNLSNTTTFYYQQRFNSQDAEDSVTVAEYLKLENGDHQTSLHEVKRLEELFNIASFSDKRLIQLSNGENKRVQIMKALLDQPTFLLLDNPFIGLDAKSREYLESILFELGKAGLHIIIVTAASRLPPFTTNLLSFSGNGTYHAGPVIPGEWNSNHQPAAGGFSFDHDLLHELTASDPELQFEFAVRMSHVNIAYDRKILDNISWEVRRGERWSLSGPNGSGKSTLLSLVNADNPQAYANEIYLFDRKRGSGESIWDIKKKTGFVSPELHLYFEAGISCFDVIASGLFDTIGLFRQISEMQSILVYKWMRLLKIEQVRNRFLHQLSNSEQRLVLLARALIKNPPLLILDEPCQGLDDDQVSVFKDIVNEICLTANKTLIYVSHYEHEIPACVTKYIRLENGKQVRHFR